MKSTTWVDGGQHLPRSYGRREFLQEAAKAIVASAVSVALPQRAHAWRSAAAPAPLQWISTTELLPWQEGSLRGSGWQWDTLNMRVEMESTNPPIEGFGACFNELGWMSLSILSAEDRESIFREMFEPGVGANFTLCRMPLGANDFSRDWYSYDEVPEDFDLKHFSIANDLETLVPFIHGAQKYNPDLRIWASPWSPPTWMKTNRHYAEAEQNPAWPPNGIRPDQVRKEGMDVFIQEKRFYDAYANYFGKFIDAYRKQGISVGMVMPQNEFNSAQAFPSCTWTPEGLGRFIVCLGPIMHQRGVEVFFGTLERGNKQLLDRVMENSEAGRWIKGVGIQWAGKNAIAQIHKAYPDLRIYQSEQECGDGKNDWSYAGYCWDLMRHYLQDGATAYMYWNLSLERGGVSRWGWAQNSLVTVDRSTKSFRFNHEYYLLKHVSHFVKRGARRVSLDGTFENALAFVNPDKSLAVILRNESSRPVAVDIAAGARTIAVTMPPDSFNTLLLPKGSSAS